MIKLNFLSVLVLLLIVTIIQSTDYCKIHDEECSKLYTDHIECVDFERKPVNEYIKYKFSEADKNFVLSQFNVLKNRYASGEFKIIPSASQLSVIKWSSEFERFAKSALSLSESNDYLCFLTDGVDGAMKFSFSTNIHENDISDILHVAVDSHLQYITRGNSEEDVEWFAQKFAPTTLIGCSGTSVIVPNKERKHIFCIYNIGGKNATSYDQGAAAAKCQHRSNVYTSLCD